MKKPLNLAAVSMLLFLSSCFSCEYDDVVPMFEDVLGGWILYRTGPDANGNNLPEEAELRAVSADKTSFMLMEQDGSGQIQGEEYSSGFEWEMKKDNLALHDAAADIRKASYDAGTKQMIIQVKTDTSAIWMVFVKQ